MKQVWCGLFLVMAVGAGIGLEAGPNKNKSSATASKKTVKKSDNMPVKQVKQQEPPRISIGPDEAFPRIEEIVETVKNRQNSKLTNQEYEDLQVYVSTLKLGKNKEEAQEGVNYIKENLPCDSRFDLLQTLVDEDAVKR